MTASELSERDQEILEFARLHWRYLGAKETEILRRFDMSATRYSQILNHLIDQPAALMHDPQLVRRLQRLRTKRQRQRSLRVRLGG